MPAYRYENGWFAKFNYKDWDGNTKQKLKRGFKTKKDALAFERDFVSKKTGKNLTVLALADLFLQEHKTEIKPSTYEEYRKAISKRIRPIFPNKDINDVSALDIKRWHNALIEKGYAKSTVNATHSILSTIFKFGVKYYGLPQNPCLLEGTAKVPDKGVKTIRYWTFEEYQEFRNAIIEEKHRVMFDMLYYSGMRVGELLALNWDDIVWEENKIKITKDLSFVDNKQIIQPPKTKASVRDIIMPQFCMDELKDWKDKLYKPQGRIFFFAKSHNTVWACMQRIAGRTELKRIRVHDLRHSHASLLISMGCPITLVSQRLGHENTYTTLNIYSHMMPNDEKEAVEKLENAYQNCIRRKNKVL